MYALNALTGALIWKTNLGTPPAVYLWASPILFNGSIYDGVSSFGDCPLVQGHMVQLDAATGRHPAPSPTSCPTAASAPASGRRRPSTRATAASTSPPGRRTRCHHPGPALAPSIVKLRATDLTILSSWTVPASEQVFGDEDFGGTPTLFTATINGVPRVLVGALNKDGLFFAWDRNNLAAGPGVAVDDRRSERQPALDRRRRVGTARTSTSAAAARRSTAQSCYGNISALDPATGAFVWRSCMDFMTAGITEVPGMLIEGVGAGGNVQFLNTANGATVLDYNTNSMVQGEVTVATASSTSRRPTGT